MAENLSTLSSTGTEGTPTGTGDRYQLMSTWEAAQQTDLVAAGDTAVLECYIGTTFEGNWNADGELNDTLFVAGWVQDATNHITITCPDGQWHEGDPDSGFLMESTGVVNGDSVVDLVNGTYTELARVRLRQNRATSRGITIGVNYVLCHNLIITADNLATASGGFTNGVPNWILRNSLIFGNGNHGANIQNAQFDNVTYTGSLTVNIRNNANSIPILNNTYASTFIITDLGGYLTATNNASSDATAPGANPQINVSTALGVDFVDPGNNNYNPTPTGKLAGTAVDLSVDFTDDITGFIRTPPWDIGAYAIQGAAPSVSFDGPNIVAQTGTQNTAFSFNENGGGTVASRFTGATSYALAPTSDALPNGLTVNATTGNIEGTPTVTFNGDIIIEGSD